MPSSLTPLLSPRSIAVIGASRRPGTVGYEIVDNLVRHGYRGIVYPVNPKARSVHSLPTWRSVRDIPGEVDLAVIVVPAERVLEVVDECGARGVPSVVVISSGFRETGAEGARREAMLLDRIRRYGMRLVGPNCMGVLSTDEGVRMNATFAPSMPPTGPVSFLSQSGALGVSILDYATEYRIGIRHFVSVGNKPDVSGNDLLEFWENDPHTKVILMYLETFGNPRRFTRIARRLARKKPIIVVKSGRNPTGARAASSHTGSSAGTDLAANALLAQCGVVRAHTVEELFDLAMAFGRLPLPAGRRVAVVTNAGGPGVMIADACEEEGLEVVELTESTRDRLEAAFPEGASVRNPVDMVTTATAESYRLALDAVLEDPAVDSAIAAFVPPFGVRQEDVATAIVDAAREHPETPVLAVLMGREGLSRGRAALEEAGVPAYVFPESAARALAALHQYSRWLRRPVQAPATFPARREEVRRILGHAQAENRDLDTLEAYGVLDAYGIGVAPHIPVDSLAKAGAAAKKLGFPVVFGRFRPQIVSGTESNETRPEVSDADGVAAAWARVTANGTRDHGEAAAVVTKVSCAGRELVLGMSTDPTFGPLLRFGAAGVYVDTFRDVAFRVPPVTEQEAREMITSIRGYPLLRGGRGEPPIDLDSVVRTIQRLSQLVHEHPAIRDVRIEPLVASTQGATVGDVRIGVAPAHVAEPVARSPTSGGRGPRG